MKFLVYEAATAWSSGIPCLFFITLIQLYLLRSFIYSLTYCIKEGIWENNLEIKWKMCRSMRQLCTEIGESLAIFQNTNRRLYVLCTIFFTCFIIKGIKVKKFWWYIKKVSAFDTDFLVWIMKKDGSGFFRW